MFAMLTLSMTEIASEQFCYMIGASYLGTWGNRLLIHKLSDGIHQEVVFFWTLCGDPEMTGREAAEIGGVTDKDVMRFCQVVF